MNTCRSETLLYVANDLDSCFNALVHTKEGRVFTGYTLHAYAFKLRV